MKSAARIVFSVCALFAACTATLAQDGLIVGVDDGATPIYIRDNGQWRELFTVDVQNPVESWGLANDNTACTLYISAGFELFVFRRGDMAPASRGPFIETVTGGNISIQGLFWLNGALYGTRTISSGGVVEGIYRINPANAECQLAVATNVDFDFSGCDADPDTGLIYALSDTGAFNPALPGLYRLSLDQTAPVRITDYRPAAQWPGRGATADVDGLAVGNHRAYMIIDEPGEFAVYNLQSNAYEANIPAPWTSIATFSSGAWGPCFLATRCVADVDDGTGTGTPDGGVTIDDLIYYITIYTDGNVAADVDDGTFTGTHDGGVTIDDLLYYLVRYADGC